MGHAYEQGPIHAEPDQKAMIERTLDITETFLGKRPVGWLGPGLTQTLDTPDILAAAGIKYIGDWVYDDEPTTIRTANGPLVTLPYTVELQRHPDDGGAASRGDYLFNRAIDQFDRLYAEGRNAPRSSRSPSIPISAASRTGSNISKRSTTTRANSMASCTGPARRFWSGTCNRPPNEGLSLRSRSVATAVLATAAQAAPCRTSGTYDTWLAAFEREALATGISQRAIAAAAPLLTYDQHIVNIDRGQRVFSADLSGIRRPHGRQLSHSARAAP